MADLEKQDLTPEHLAAVMGAVDTSVDADTQARAQAAHDHLLAVYDNTAELGADEKSAADDLPDISALERAA